MKTSALRTWLRQERARDYEAWLEGNPTTKNPHLDDEWTGPTQWFVSMPLGSYSNRLTAYALSLSTWSEALLRFSSREPTRVCETVQ